MRELRTQRGELTFSLGFVALTIGELGTTRSVS